MENKEIFDTIVWAKANKDRLNSTQLSYLKRFEEAVKDAEQKTQEEDG